AQAPVAGSGIAGKGTEEMPIGASGPDRSLADAARVRGQSDDGLAVPADISSRQAAGEDDASGRHPVEGIDAVEPADDDGPARAARSRQRLASRLEFDQERLFVGANSERCR